jgi:hypothetical protein
MLVLDANILMRAVLGKHVRALLAKYGERIEPVPKHYRNSMIYAQVCHTAGGVSAWHGGAR